MTFFGQTLLQQFQRERLRRSATGIKPVHCLSLIVPNDRKQIAADTVSRWLHQTQRRVSSDRCVDCRATFLENVQSNLGRQRLTGRRHAMLGNHFASSRKVTTCDSVLSGGDRKRGQPDGQGNNQTKYCLLYTSPSPRDRQKSRMPSSA